MFDKICKLKLLTKAKHLSTYSHQMLDSRVRYDLFKCLLIIDSHCHFLIIRQKFCLKFLISSQSIVGGILSLNYYYSTANRERN